MSHTDTPPDTITSGIAVLAEDNPTWDDGPFPVRGVALPEKVVTHGANTQNTAVYWPADTVADAVALFDGAKITDPSEHDPETALENPQPSPETIIGEITTARYEPGVGVLYEGEVDDPQIAKRIDRGRVEVSPTLFRRLGGTHNESGAREASEIVGVRDLSVVARGAATGNSIEPASAALSALSASALSAAFEPADATDSSQSDDGEDVTTRQSTGAASTSTDKSVTTMDDIENENTTDEPLAEPLRDILAIVDDPSEAVDVLKQYEFADEPVVVEKSEVQTLQQENEEARDAFAGVLEEQGPFSADSLADSKMSTLTEPFRDEDGEIDLDVLAQQPETGSLQGGDEGDDPVGLEALSADDRDEARELYRRQQMLDSRTPQHAESLRGDLVEMMGVDSFDDIDVEAF